MTTFPPMIPPMIARRPQPFPGESPSGLTLLPEVVTESEESQVLLHLAGLDFQEVRMHGVAALRTTRHYGWRYGYDAWSLEPADPLPEALGFLRARAAQWVNVDATDLAEVLVSRYPPGAGIGWHRDAPMFGPTVVGISFGASCQLRFRRKSESGWSRMKVLLPPRSAYVLSGEARSKWQHSILAVAELRYSVTFRTVLGQRHGSTKSF